MHFNDKKQLAVYFLWQKVGILESSTLFSHFAVFHFLVHHKTKHFVDFLAFNSGFLKKWLILYLTVPEPSLWVIWGSLTNFCPISSAVWPFIGYKTDTPTNRGPNLIIFRGRWVAYYRIKFKSQIQIHPYSLTLNRQHR